MNWYQELNQLRSEAILGEQAKDMSYIVIANIPSSEKAARAVVVMENNIPVADKFKERIFIWNGIDNDDLRHQLQRFGYKAIYMPTNRGYELGFLDLCVKANESVTNPYLQMNADIKLSPSVLDILIDTNAELNYIPAISCLHKSRTEYGPMGQVFIHTPTKGFAQYDGTDKSVCSEYVLRDTCQGHQYCLMDEPILQAYEAFVKRYRVGDASAKNVEFNPYGITHWHFDGKTLKFL